MAFNGDSDLEVKVRKGTYSKFHYLKPKIIASATERISENMHIVANEPSLAFYRLQEHVRKALNPMVDRRVDVNNLHQELQGHCYDIEYAVRSVMDNGRITVIHFFFIAAL
jgi:hypothetical protein